ncbi:ATPases with chaperone activity%2C ATP-binding subunit [Streptococcus suis]|uniref:ATPases with chaperone activity, ATP-binding subunit n=2 Tax=Streptococcus suis TaxID=1307 RepID=A0A0Z8ERC3_STRSU|nr:ATPases with chaperone activity%2C ATP-binding subunit [Streptococcus suis]CYU66878.1 ATPases with chaperone activity%2C ATP-binding subunit [Streptococcus suis]CYU95917.1 ATPases with chaperone activity%2C ATP-binding subunit [Streptococcus suis]
MRATFLQFKEKVKVMKFFQKKTQNQDRFKRLIHRLSEMSDTELTKVEQLLDVVFDINYKPSMNEELPKTVKNIEEPSLDKSIQEAKNKLDTEQLEKNIERFRQGRRNNSS